jgi:phospholipid/cholesterol/gamma-HCH transport system substrate-binding protein
MKDEARREVKVGLTVFIGILIFVFVIMWAKNFSIDSEHQTLVVKFPTVSGLHKKDVVSVNGLNKGFVQNIKIDGNGVLVTLNLDSDVKLQKDATFSVVMLDLMGGKKVEISSGSSAEKLDFNEVQRGRFLGDFSTAMAMFTNVEEDLIDIIHETKQITISLNDFINKDNLSGKLTVTLDNVNKTLKSVENILEENKSNLNLLVSNSAEMSDSIKIFWTKNNSELTELLRSSSQSVKSADSLIRKMDALITQTKAEKNNAGKLLYDSKLFDQLKNTLEQLNELTKIVNKQLKNEGLNVKTHIF